MFLLWLLWAFSMPWSALGAEHRVGGRATCAVSWNPSHTRVPVCTRTVSCFGALGLKVNCKSKDFNLIFAIQLFPIKFCPSLCITLYWKRKKLDKRFSLHLAGLNLWRLGMSQERVHGFLDPESTLWSTQHPSSKQSSAQVWVVFIPFSHTECHGRCVCGWVKQAYGWLEKGRATSGFVLASFVLVRGIWACICFPHLTPQGTLFAELLAVRTSLLNLLSDTTL